MNIMWVNVNLADTGRGELIIFKNGRKKIGFRLVFVFCFLLTIVNEGWSLVINDRKGRRLPSLQIKNKPHSFVDKTPNLKIKPLF